MLHYDSMETKYESKVKLCNIVTDILVYEREEKDLYKNIEKDVRTKFHRSWYLKDDTRKLMKDELGGKFMMEFVAKTYAYRKLYKKLKNKVPRSV